MSDAIKVITTDFNYGMVDPETAAKLEYFAKSGKALIRKSQIQFIAEFGKILSEAHDILSSQKNGTFIRWATSEFDLSKATVYNYMNAWDRILSNGWTLFSHWSPTAVYLASGDDVSPPVQKKLENLPVTELVRASDVLRIIEANKPKPAPPEADDPPFDDVEEPASDPRETEKAAKLKLQAEEKAAKERAREEAKAAKEAERAAAKAAKEQAKADAKAAKEKARLEAMTTEGQIKSIKHLINQHMGKMVRLMADLNRVKPNRAAMNANMKVLEGFKLW